MNVQEKHQLRDLARALALTQNLLADIISSADVYSEWRADRLQDAVRALLMSGLVETQP